MRLLAFLAQSASACTVCFGLDKNAAIAKGLTMGIALLIVTVLSLAFGIAYWCWKIEKAKQAREQSA